MNENNDGLLESAMAEYAAKHFDEVSARLEEEKASSRLLAEDLARLRADLAQANATIAELRGELERVKAERDNAIALAEGDRARFRQNIDAHKGLIQAMLFELVGEAHVETEADAVALVKANVATIAELRARHEQACAVVVGLREALKTARHTIQDTLDVLAAGGVEARKIKTREPANAEHWEGRSRAYDIARRHIDGLTPTHVERLDAALAAAAPLAEEHDAKVRAEALEEAAEVVGVNGLGAELTARRIRALAATAPTGTKETT